MTTQALPSPEQGMYAHTYTPKVDGGICRVCGLHNKAICHVDAKSRYPWLLIYISFIGAIIAAAALIGVFLNASARATGHRQVQAELAQAKADASAATSQVKEETDTEICLVLSRIPQAQFLEQVLNCPVTSQIPKVDPSPTPTTLP